jgi:hypothetical protein
MYFVEIKRTNQPAHGEAIGRSTKLAADEGLTAFLRTGRAERLERSQFKLEVNSDAARALCFNGFRVLTTIPLWSGHARKPDGHLLVPDGELLSALVEERDMVFQASTGMEQKPGLAIHVWLCHLELRS